MSQTNGQINSKSDSDDHDPSDQSAKHRLRVLWVEDHVDTARCLAKLMTAWGYAVTTAVDVAEALAFAQQQTFDIVLSDIGLGDGDGCDLMRALRASYPHLRGIALSGYAMDSDISRTSDAGFERHLLKPIDPPTLRRTINEVAGIHSEQKP